MEDLDRRIAARRLGEAADFRALHRLAGISLGGEHDGNRAVRIPAQVEAVEHAVARGQQRRQQIAHQSRQQRLAFGVAEADIVLDELRPLARQHQPGIEHALEGPPLRRHALDRRHDDTVHDLAFERRGEARRGRIGAHAAGIGSGVALADALVVPRRGERQRMRAVDQREEARLLALEKLLDDHFCPGGAEALRHHGLVDGRFRLGDARRHGDALARRQPVGLDDDRRAALADERLRLDRVAEAAIGSGGDAVFGAEILGEALGALERGGRF